MRMSFGTIVVAASVLALLAPTTAGADIACKTIGLAYDSLFVDVNGRVEKISEEFKAMPKNAPAPTRDALRRRFCATGGELVGLYKFVRALANDCSAQGEKMGELLDVINKQLGLAEKSLKEPCG